MGFNLFIIVLLAGGWLGSRIFSALRLPGILGMLLFGIGFGVFAGEGLPQLAWEIEPFVKGVALVIILLRAGLGIQRSSLQQVGKTALLLAFVPCIFEAAALMPLLHYVFDLSWLASAMAAWMLAAVSPAVVVPSMLELQERGAGSRNQVPTMVLAGASVDDVVAITFFSLFLSVHKAGGLAGAGVAGRLGMLPLSIAGGVLLGAVAGFLIAWWFVRHDQHIRATEKFLLLLVFSMLLVEIGDAFALAALLGVMTVGFVLLERAEAIAHKMAKKLAKVWIAAEIVLFVYIGMQLDPSVALDSGLRGLAVIAAGLCARTLGVLLVVAFDRRLVWSERFFCAVAYLPKATVQAALGSVPLAAGVPGGDRILSLAVLAIAFTAPLGLILIRIMGKRLPQ